MALSYEDLAAKYPVDRELVETHKERMLAEVRAYRLREQAGLTQASWPNESASASGKTPRSSTTT